MFKITRLTAFIALFFIFSVSYGQDKTIDSVNVILKNPKIHDTLKLFALSETLATQYSRFEDEQKYYYLNSIMGKLAMENYKKDAPVASHRAYAKYLAEYYSAIAVRESRNRNFIKAFACIDKSIALYKSAKTYEDMNFAIVTKGTFFSETQEYEKAIACLYGPLRYFENSKGKYRGEGINYVNTYIAQIYIKQKKDEKAIPYYNKVNAYYATIKMTPYDLHAQSYIYSNLGSCYATLKKYPEAIENYNKAAQLCEKTNDAVTANINLCKIADVKADQSKFDEAEQILRKILANPADDYSESNTYLSLGELYYKKKDFAKADTYLSKALEMNKKTGDLTIKRSAVSLLYQVNEQLKNYKKALEMHLVHEKLIDDEKIETSKNALIQQQLKYDFEKKELNYKLAAEKKTAAKNNWLIALSALLLLLLSGIYYYYRNSKQKQAITTLEKNQIKQKLLITQMNPHFIFNSIQNIRSLIFDHQNNEAVNYLDKFSKLTRQILENSNENYISLTEEVDMIENYLGIQQLLYNHKFGFTITVEDTIDTDSTFLPPMLTQPFIENAIKHGLSNTTQNGMITIVFYLKESKLFFEVSDNGKGFDTAKKTAGHKSLAMTITKERLVNYTKNQDFVVQTDNIIGRDENIIGAKVSFEIPYIYEN